MSYDHVTLHEEALLEEGAGLFVSSRWQHNASAPSTGFTQTRFYLSHKYPNYGAKDSFLHTSYYSYSEGGSWCRDFSANAILHASNIIQTRGFLCGCYSAVLHTQMMHTLTCLCCCSYSCCKWLMATCCQDVEKTSNVIFANGFIMIIFLNELKLISQ